MIIISVGIRVASNIKKNSRISSEAKARIKKTWREMRRVMYARWRLIGSEARWFWLARIMMGSNQHESTRRGADTESVAMYIFRDFHPVSEGLENQVRVSIEIRMAWAKTVGHSHLARTFQVVRISIIVGTSTFSIVGGLSFVGGPSRVFGLSQLAGPGLHWLRRLREPGE